MESKHHHRPRKSFEIITLSHEIMNEFSLLVGTVETRPRVQQTLSLRSRFRVLYCPPLTLQDARGVPPPRARQGGRCTTSAWFVPQGAYG